MNEEYNIYAGLKNQHSTLILEDYVNRFKTRRLQITVVKNQKVVKC